MPQIIVFWSICLANLLKNFRWLNYQLKPYLSKVIKVIFTLFNLQGTALRQSLVRLLVYLSTSSSVCQELFSGFFEEFSRFTFKPNSSIFPPVLSNLHRFLSLFVCRSLERLDILSYQLPFVNTFFHLFSKKFLGAKKPPFRWLGTGLCPTNSDIDLLRKSVKYTCRCVK